VENNNLGTKDKEAMKHRSTQLGVRKNPDSQRVHGLPPHCRFVVVKIWKSDWKFLRE